MVCPCTYVYTLGILLSTGQLCPEDNFLTLYVRENRSLQSTLTECRSITTAYSVQRTYHKSQLYEELHAGND